MNECGKEKKEGMKKKVKAPGPPPPQELIAVDILAEWRWLHAPIAFLPPHWNSNEHFPKSLFFVSLFVRRPCTAGSGAIIY